MAKLAPREPQRGAGEDRRYQELDVRPYGSAVLHASHEEYRCTDEQIHPQHSPG